MAPAQLPADDKLVGPYVRYELIEDRFEKQQNRNLIGRPEFFALGLDAERATGQRVDGHGLDTRRVVVFRPSSAAVSSRPPSTPLIAEAKVSGQLQRRARVQHQHLAAQSQYYLPQSQHWLFYASMRPMR